MKVHEFGTSKRVGDFGEDVFSQLLGLIGANVEDVSGDKKWQKMGIDFVADGVWYDTKYDTRSNETGNIAVETVSRRVDGVVEAPGWIYTSEADYIVYIYQWGQRWIVQFFTTENLREIVKGKQLRPVYNRGYQAEVALVPVKTLDEYPYITFPVVESKVNVDVFRSLHKEAMNGKRD